MATGSVAQSSEQSSSSSSEQPCAAKPDLRLWPAVLLVALFWGFLFGYEWIDLSMFHRFISRWAAMATLLIGYFGWWLTNRRFSRGERWWAIAATIGGCVVASLLADPTARTFLFMMALPGVFTAWTAWLLAAQNLRLTPRARQAGLYLSIWAVLAYYALVRWDGLDGGQHGVYTWRWQPTAEQQFLAAHPIVAEEPADAGTSDSALAPGNTSTMAPGEGDWPEFRGPGRRSQLAGLHLASDWQSQAPQPLWRQRVGPAWSSMIVIGERLFTQEQRGENEMVVAYDAATGAEVWTHADELRFFEGLSGAGPRGTPTFANGQLFTLGGTGKLNCLDAATGRAIWSRDVAADSGADVPQWGYSNSPIVAGDVVVVFAGGKDDRGLLAYRRETGELAWQAAAGTNSYSSPQLATIAGHDQLLMLSEVGLLGFEPATGELLWELASSASGPVTPVAQPQYVGEGKFLIQVGAGIALVEVVTDGEHWTAREVWKSESLKPSLNDFVVLDDAIYGFDDGIFCCLDLKTGNRNWKRGRYGHGQVLAIADQRLLLVVGEAGEAVLLAANPRRHEELARVAAIEGKTWNHPVVAHGRLYARNAEEIACYTLPTVR